VVAATAAMIFAWAPQVRGYLALIALKVRLLLGR